MPRVIRSFVALSCVLVLAACGGSVASTGSTPATVSGQYPSGVALNAPGAPIPDGLLDTTVPAYDSATGFTPDATRMLTVLSLELALERYASEHQAYPPSLDALFPADAPLGSGGQPMSGPPSTGDGYTFSTDGSAYTLSVVLASGQPFTVSQAATPATGHAHPSLERVAADVAPATPPGDHVAELDTAPRVRVDNSAANEIATGKVVDGTPGAAKVTVTNNYHFWVASELQSPVGGADLRPDWSELSGLFAGGGLIAPNGNAAWTGRFDPTLGGSQSVHVHFGDMLSAGGAVTTAGNVVSIVGDALGVTLVAKSAADLLKAFDVLSALAAIDHLSEAMAKNDPWGVAIACTELLGTDTGRAALTQALGILGASVGSAALKKIASGVFILDLGKTMIDMTRATLGDHFEGTVTFALDKASSGQSTASSSPSASQSAAPSASPTPKPVPAGPPAPPSGLTFVSPSEGGEPLFSCISPVSQNGQCGRVHVTWQASTGDAHLQIYYFDDGIAECFAGECHLPTSEERCQARLDDPSQFTLIADVPEANGSVDAPSPPPFGLACVYARAVNAAGTSAWAVATDATPEGQTPPTAPPQPSWKVYDGGFYRAQFPDTAHTMQLGPADFEWLSSYEPTDVAYYASGSATDPTLVYFMAHCELARTNGDFDPMAIAEKIMPSYGLSTAKTSEVDVRVDGWIDPAEGLFVSGNGFEGVVALLHDGAEQMVLGAFHKTGDTQLDIQRFFDSFHYGN